MASSSPERIGLQLFQAAQTAADRAEVGERAAQPAIADERHAAAHALLLDGVAGLALRPHEQDQAPLGRHALQVLSGTQQAADGFANVDNMDQVAAGINIRPHLRVPPAGAVAKVDPGFNQVFYEYGCQIKSPQGTPAMSTLARGRRPALFGHCGQVKKRLPAWTVQEGKPKSLVIIDGVVNWEGEACAENSPRPYRARKGASGWSPGFSRKIRLKPGLQPDIFCRAQYSTFRRKDREHPQSRGGSRQDRMAERLAGEAHRRGYDGKRLGKDGLRK